MSMFGENTNMLRFFTGTEALFCKFIRPTVGITAIARALVSFKDD